MLDGVEDDVVSAADGGDAAATDGGGDDGAAAASTDADTATQAQAASVGGGGGGGNGTRTALIAVFGTLLPLVLVALAVYVVVRRRSRREAWAEFNDGAPGGKVLRSLLCWAPCCAVPPAVPPAVLTCIYRAQVSCSQHHKAPQPHATLLQPPPVLQENGTNGAKIPLDATDATWASSGLDSNDTSMRSLGVHTAAAELAGASNGANGANGGSALGALGPNPPGSLFPTSSGKDPTTQVTPLAPLTLALDALCAKREKFLDKYAPLGLAHRRLGRTAVVQIFEDPETQKRYAIKFYRSRTSFDCERAAYGRTAIAEAVAVPQHGIVTEPGTGPDGYRWPPCIVMDVGEPLDVFLARIPRGDDATIRTALADIAAVVETLHSKGWAHRNLKPSNVLFLADTERWVLCDLERCSRVGAFSHLSVSCVSMSFTCIRFMLDGVGGVCSRRSTAR